MLDSPWFDSQAFSVFERMIALTGGTVRSVAAANLNRWALIIDSPGTGRWSTRNNVATTDGISVGGTTANAILTLAWPTHGSLCQQEIFVVPNLNSNWTIIEVLKVNLADSLALNHFGRFIKNAGRTIENNRQSVIAINSDYLHRIAGQLAFAGSNNFIIAANQ